jgi:hypothetical protein
MPGMKMAFMPHAGGESTTRGSLWFREASRKPADRANPPLRGLAVFQTQWLHHYEQRQPARS